MASLPTGPDALVLSADVGAPAQSSLPASPRARYEAWSQRGFGCLPIEVVFDVARRSAGFSSLPSECVEPIHEVLCRRAERIGRSTDWSLFEIADMAEGIFLLSLRDFRSALSGAWDAYASFADASPDDEEKVVRFLEDRLPEGGCALVSRRNQAPLVAFWVVPSVFPDYSRLPLDEEQAATEKVFDLGDRDGREAFVSLLRVACSPRIGGFVGKTGSSSLNDGYAMAVRRRFEDAGLLPVLSWDQALQLCRHTAVVPDKNLDEGLSFIDRGDFSSRASYLAGLSLVAGVGVFPVSRDHVAMWGFPSALPGFHSVPSRF